MSHFDTVLKELILEPRSLLVEDLTGSRVKQWLDVELPKTRNARVDLVCELEDGRVWHLELQSSNDGAMDWRALEYYALIGGKIKKPVVQVILYVGEAPLRMRGRLDHPSLQFRYQIVDVRDFDAERFLGSVNPGDALFAILCRVQDKRLVVRRILQRIGAMEPSERSDALARLLVLSGLRGVDALVIKESETMPVVIDPMKNSVLRKWYFEALARGREEGRQEGREEGRLLRRQLQKRFGTLPAWAEERLDASTIAEREDWALRLLDAASLDDVFAS